MSEEHIAPAKGQTVHCERATFVAVAFPSDAWARFRLGFWLGAGALAGCTVTVGFMVVAHKLLAMLS